MDADKEERYLAIIARLIDIARRQHKVISELMDDLQRVVGAPTGIPPQTSEQEYRA